MPGEPTTAYLPLPTYHCLPTTANLPLPTYHRRLSSNGNGGSNIYLHTYLPTTAYLVAMAVVVVISTYLCLPTAAYLVAMAMAVVISTHLPTYPPTSTCSNRT